MTSAICSTFTNLFQAGYAQESIDPSLEGVLTSFNQPTINADSNWHPFLEDVNQPTVKAVSNLHPVSEGVLSTVNQPTANAVSNLHPVPEGVLSTVNQPTANAVSLKKKSVNKFSADFIFEKIFSEDQKLFFNEEEGPPKGISNGMYLVNNHKYTIDSILADDNGCYINEGTPSTLFHYEKDSGICTTVHKNKENGRYYYKKRVGRCYMEEFVDNSNVYVLQRYYRRHSFNKNFLNLICRIKPLLGEFTRYTLVINQRSDPDKENLLKIQCHGNAATDHAKSKPYLRTEKKITDEIRSTLTLGAKPKD